jgi:hypothetical protein
LNIGFSAKISHLRRSAKSKRIVFFSPKKAASSGIGRSPIAGAELRQPHPDLDLKKQFCPFCVH